MGQAEVFLLRLYLVLISCTWPPVAQIGQVKLDPVTADSTAQLCKSWAAVIQKQNCAELGKLRIFPKVAQTAIFGFSCNCTYLISFLAFACGFRFCSSALLF